MMRWWRRREAEERAQCSELNAQRQMLRVANSGLCVEISVLRAQCSEYRNQCSVLREESSVLESPVLSKREGGRGGRCKAGGRIENSVARVWVSLLRIQCA